MTNLKLKKLKTNLIKRLNLKDFEMYWLRDKRKGRENRETL